MRIYDRKSRIPLSRENEQAIFLEELAYYREHNRYPVTLFGKPIINIYKNINVQILVSRACNYHCPFCIENDRMGRGKEVELLGLIHAVLCRYMQQGISPTVSITGGEPTLFPNRLARIVDTCLWYGDRVSINTNGSNQSALAGMDVHVNVSRHHYDPEKIRETFGDRDVPRVLNLPKRTLQCVMMKGYIETVQDIKDYILFYAREGFSSFSFRGLTKLDAGKLYVSEAAYTAEHDIDFLSIIEQIAHDDEFEFVQQKVGDHYLYEFYKYAGCFLRLTYSNYEFLRQVETEERARGEWFSRATIIHPQGIVYAGWTYDINEIYRKERT